MGFSERARLSLGIMVEAELSLAGWWGWTVGDSHGTSDGGARTRRCWGGIGRIEEKMYVLQALGIDLAYAPEGV